MFFWLLVYGVSNLYKCNTSMASMFSNIDERDKVYYVLAKGEVTHVRPEIMRRGRGPKS